VALEFAKGPIVAALQKYEFFVLFPINPLALARYREAFKPSRAKDDPTDAELALDLLLHHPERFAPLKPQSALMRSLLTLIEQRRELVDDKTSFTDRLGNTLKQYYPQVLELFGKLDNLMVCDFLARWPTLEVARRAHRSKLQQFFCAHNCRRAALNEARINTIKTAEALTEEPAIVTPCRLHVLALVEQLRITLAAIERFDAQIEAVANEIPDYRIFRALPGAGPGLAPRLMAAFGEQRERFQSAAALQMYAGIASVTEHSGKKS